MLSRIDEIIFPNRCEVIEFTDPQRFVYPIFKNGSTSLIKYAKDNKLKILLNNQIKKVPNITVILRDPEERFVSGFNTFVFNTIRDNPQLDLTTVIYFAEHYLFLDRHYAPQLSWLINLSKYIDLNKTILHFQGMDSLSNYTPYTLDSREGYILNEELILRLKKSKENNHYHKLELLLLNLVNQKLTFNEVIEYLRNQDPVASSKIQCIALD